MSTLTKIYSEQYDKYIENRKAYNLSNNLTIFASYYATVVNTFSWKLPSEKIPFFFPEKWLCYSGLMVGFKDGGKFNMFQGFPIGMFEEYGEFSKYVAISVNGKTKEIPIDECALCYNNTLMIPSIWLINDLANNATLALESVNKTLRRAVFSKIITAKDRQQIDTLKGILESGEIKDPRLALLTVSEAVKSGDVSVNALFDNRMDDILSLWDVYIRYRNMFYTTFGTNTVEITKKERLTQAEGSGNDEISRYGLLKDMYSCRKDFCKQCKDKFDVEISFEINRDPTTVYNIISDNESKIENEIIEMSKGANIERSSDSNEDENNDRND